MRSLLLIAIFLSLLALVATTPTANLQNETNANANALTNTDNPLNKSTPSNLSQPSPRDFKKPDVTCSLPPKYEHGNSKDLEKAADWLGMVRSKDATKPRLGAGKCQTAACYRGTKIRWCNDNKETKELPSWQNIADGAWVISNSCRQKKWKVLGELDHADKWRVLAFAEHCYMQPGPES
ncbi:uncharacterized protein BDV14DRAFT_195285 [Aspergillus stella-maris]|uniref:uncharacterized protein n=1 Tax=Aspergillus stella-maris TaxID=1810926 RepID=UPI003CCD64FD